METKTIMGLITELEMVMTIKAIRTETEMEMLIQELKMG